ncbi:serine/threonine-protein kinase [Aeoliella mucimassa]|uniref:non-specific serine/threonine protein kinase n=1 Tax=Aeoliella mucimassa TaxID=2527972 RepID=A0A518AUT8_9BACT|nr:serine/threonine-protein kinase [Aeoliella mucimassa]QDU58485.1 Serine/threonine-protein kinase PknB [Aeoliella mucimassa]
MDFEKLGPYRIGNRLGKGGMGSVYRGEHNDTGQVVAVKALAPQLATSEGFRERFEAEIESLKTLQHDGIVRLFGYGEESGTLFYAMELVDGRSLEEELKAGRRFSWREVVDISIQVCRALKHAHDHGIVHRDIKPANILLDTNEHVKLADFGIARLFGGTQLTMAGGVLGTADYMSPEQADGRPVTDRCDQYSLGCVMYALLAGRPPFRAKSLPEMLQLQRFAEPEPVRRYAPDAPEQLEHCIMQLLKKNASDRFPNTLVLSRHLEAMRKALSRPIDAPELASNDGMPSILDPPKPDSPKPPLAYAATVAGTEHSSPESQASIDIDVVPTAVRDAVTVDSLTDSSTRRAMFDATKTDHFTAVDHGSRPSSSGVSPSVWIASLGLLALVGISTWFVWQVMQPSTADELYAKIRPVEEMPDIDHLRGYEAEVNEFVARFSDDPRAGEVLGYQEELLLEKLQRRFDTLVRGRGERGDLNTAERLYLAAMRKLDADPVQAAKELEHLEQLFGQVGDEGSQDAEQLERVAACVELARRQRALLEQRLAAQHEDDLATLASRLDHAESLYESDPAQATAICTAVVELYGNDPWAEPMVRRARELLEAWR